MYIVRVLVCFVYCFFSSNTTIIASEDLQFTKITTDDGLSQNSVLAISQDAKGFMWFGTQDGLNRYDGYQHIIFRNDPNNPNSISDNRIRCIYVDSKGTLWVGSEGGLSQFKPETQEFLNYRHQPGVNTSLGHNTVRAIFEDHSGELWIGTRGGGLNLFNRSKGTFERFMCDPSNENSIACNEISSIDEDSLGNLWIGTFKSGVSRLDRTRSKFTRFLHDEKNPKSLSHNKALQIYCDSKDTIWVGTYGGGLNRFDHKTEEFKKHLTDSSKQSSISGNRIRSIYEDSQGQLIIGTNSGLNIMDRQEEKFFNYRHDNTNTKSLSENTIQSIYQDLSGVIWLGTKDGVSTIVPKKKFKNIGTQTLGTLSHSSVSSILEENSGTYWIGTNGGGLNLVDLKKGINTIYTNDKNDPTSLSSNDVRAIFRDRSNNLWFGTYIGGLNKFNRTTETFEHFVNNSSTNSLSGNNVLDIKEDQEGLLWVATNLNGLNAFNPTTSTFTNFENDISDPKSLSSNRVWSLLIDSQNTLWAGTYGDGLNRLDRVTNKFLRYKFDVNNKNSLSNNVVLSMHEDTLGRLWVGTQGGLNLFDSGTETFTRYTEQNGLSNNVINGIAEDTTGNIWLSTNKGIEKFTPETGVFNNYEKDDGLINNQYNPGATLQTSDGTIFFGGRKGLTFFTPQEIVNNSYIPPVIFTSFTQSGEKLSDSSTSDGTRQINLTWLDNYFEFSFAALNHVQPRKNQYAYMLEGLDNDWYFAGNKHQGRYSSIPPGRYVLKIKGSNNDGLWNEEGESVQIIVSYPPWKTPHAFFFYALISTVFLLSIYFVFRRKERSKLLEKQKLENLVTARTDDLRKLNEEQLKEISERKKIEQQLKESKRTLSTLISNLPGMAYRCSNDFMWPMHFISDGCHGVTGYDPVEISEPSSLTYGDIIYPEDRQNVWDNVQESIQLNQPYELEYRITSKDGSIKWVWERGRLVAGDTSDEIHLEGFIADITQQKELADNLQQSQKMESIGNLAGGIAHEFNNMLAIIIGNNELINQELPQKSLAKESSEEIRIAGLRARDVVKQLLTFSRQDNTSKEVLDLNSVVQEAMKLIRSSTPVNIMIEQNLSADTLKIMGNDTQINQILINLCNNAIDALPGKGGAIRIELLSEVITLEQGKHQIELLPGRYLKLTITDNGTGMEKEILNRVFEPYYTTKDVGEGTGIGLAVVHGIVERHNGKIFVDSEPGHGTTFTIYLPAYEGQLNEESDEVGTLPLGDEHILFVDDELSIVKLGKRLLDGLGYTTESTDDPVKALDMVRSDPHKFDLLITDMAMPNMTGDQLVVEILKVRQDMPTILCTGYSSKISHDKAVDIGASSFIMKPINTLELAKAVRKVLDDAKK